MPTEDVKIGTTSSVAVDDLSFAVDDTRCSVDGVIKQGGQDTEDETTS